MKLQAFLDRLRSVTHNGNGWMARCPAHEDKKPSLSICERNGNILLKCFAGCSFEAVCAALGIEPHELLGDNGAAPRIVAEYDYRDEKGDLLFQVVRYEPKDFRQRRPDGEDGWTWNLNGVRRVPYRLPEVLAANSVLVCEGEKDCETGRALGIVATCNPGGAGKWREEYSEHLRGKQITIIADADEPGRKHAQQVAVSLSGKAESVKVLEFAQAKDLSEWSATGGTRDALIELIGNTPESKPTAETPNRQTGGAVLRCFRDIAPKAMRWLWPRRIPLGKLTLLIGDPGLGKSLLTADVASHVTRGTSFPDGAMCESGSVIFLSAEDDPADTIRPRLDAAGADVSRVHVLEAVRVQHANGSLTEKTFNLETDIAVLEGALREHPDVRLIVIDPLSAYLGGVDSHSNAEVRGMLTPLVALAGRFGVAVLCVTHLRKSAGAAIYRAISSIAFAAAARAVWAVASDPEDWDRRLLLAVKQNLSASAGGLAFRIETQNNVPRLAWEPGAVALAANDVLGNMEMQDQSERREAKEWLKDFLADGPVAVKKIQAEAKAAGHSWITVRRAKEALPVVASKSGYQGKWEWRLEHAHSKEAHPIDTTVSTFEQAIENANLNGNHISKDVQHSEVSTFDAFEDDGEVRL
jgi:putative DNA primase/helicase